MRWILGLGCCLYCCLAGRFIFLLARGFTARALRAGHVLCVFVFLYIIVEQLYVALPVLLILATMPLIFAFVRAVEKSCLIRLKKPSELTVGDWLMSDVHINGKTIKKTVHGLSESDIRKLKKMNKKVWIKDGVPFTPAFLVTLILGIFLAKVFAFVT